MIKIICTTSIALALTFSQASADDGKKDHDLPRTACFNLVCTYQKADGPGYTKCEAAAQFQKLVTDDGSEIDDNSEYPFNPKFEVSCDNEIVFNDAARRFTDNEGTRLQAEAGPYPAVLLPKDSLREGHFYALSSLELQDQILRGYCYVYTGAP